MVEVHCAHGYLVSTFLSQRTNHRTDEFGGANGAGAGEMEKGLSV